MRSQNELVIEFMGGMGNQMFQYALYYNLLSTGKKVKCAITNCNPDFPFVLNIFPDIDYQEVNYDDYRIKKQKFENRNLFVKVINKIIPMTKTIYCENEKKGYDKGLFRLNNKIIRGYFQNAKYVENVADYLKRAFVFPPGEIRLQQYADDLKKDTYVSVHIRRGDYLKYPHIYGGICETAYYEKAIEYFKNIGINNFIFFSNDLNWVQERFNQSTFKFFSKDMFLDYQDWYDMYIMSLCSHNIIANSTFSWWGAWLNANKQKTVIAPRIWINTYNNNGIYPENWIRI